MDGRYRREGYQAGIDRAEGPAQSRTSVRAERQAATGQARHRHAEASALHIRAWVLLAPTYRMQVHIYPKKSYSVLEAEVCGKCETRCHSFGCTQNCWVASHHCVGMRIERPEFVDDQTRR